MKRLFRRPQDSSSKSGYPADDQIAPTSDADLSYPSYEAAERDILIIDEAVLKQEQREERRQHHRAWSLESDFRISRVILSPLMSPLVMPLAPFRENYTDVAEACWIPTAASMTSFAGSMSRLAPSHSFLSTASIGARCDDTSMPSWPSSILCRPDDSSPRPSPDREEDQSLVDATPRSKLPAAKYSTSMWSPLTIDSAVQVDEFGRIVMTVKGDSNEKLGPQVRFKDTTVAISAPALSSPTLAKDPVGTLATKASRDTFGNDVDKCCSNEDLSCSCDTEEKEVELSAPLPLISTPLASPESTVSKLKTPLQSLSKGPDICFPALCQAASSMTLLQDQEGPSRGDCVIQRCTPDTTPALLPPIELPNETVQHVSFVDPPRAFQDDIQFAPWRSSRQIALSSSKSDGRLLDYRPTHKSRSLARAESSIDCVARKYNDENSIPPSIVFPNPHASVDLSSVQDELFLSPISTQASISDEATIASTEESHASVRSIIDQQRLAMEKLSQAGFWQPKTVDVDKAKIDKVNGHTLPALPHDELVSKVSQWAWLLSSELEKLAEEDDGVITWPSSPAKCLDGEFTKSSKGSQAGCEEEEIEGKRSWEWLASEEDFVEDSFGSNETVIDMTLQQDGGVDTPGLPQRRLPRTESIEKCQTREESCCRRKDDEALGGEDESMPVNTPELNQRESRTTAAIEALLTQIQRSQDPTYLRPKSSVVPKVGTSFLYRQILRKIEEEEIDQRDDNKVEL